MYPNHRSAAERFCGLPYVLDYDAIYIYIYHISIFLTTKTYYLTEQKYFIELKQCPAKQIATETANINIIYEI